MIWLAISAFFFWMIFREFKSKVIPADGFDQPDSSPINIAYVLILLVLALGFAWPWFSTWQLEQLLSKKATILADGNRAKVHCNTVFDTLFDQNSLAAGHANPKTGVIVFQYPWCNRLLAYIDHPARANTQEITALHILTHEAMHLRGEMNEAVTECQAVQRNYRTALLLSVPKAIAKKTAVDYYQGEYRRRAEVGGMAGAYFSDQCAPGKSLDERLPDLTWGPN